VTRNRFLLAACSLVLVACFNQAPPANSPAPQQISARTADRLWFSGTSNIRDFTCNAGQVYVSAEAAPEDFERTKEDGLPAVRTAALEVPVRSLDCGIALQNTDLFEALGATANPTISFALTSYAVERSPDGRDVKIRGALRIAGVERNVVVHGIVYGDSGGHLILRGNRTISMRDFGIAPPRRFLGVLRAHDEVNVHFQLVVRPLIDPLGVLATSVQ
jgi:YceI-like domain